MEQPRNIIGPQVRILRYQAGLTQDQLAARCQRLGLDITRGTLAKIEAAIRTVTDDEIPFISRALSVRLEQLYPSGLVSLTRKARNPRGARWKK